MALTPKKSEDMGVVESEDFPLAQSSASALDRRQTEATWPRYPRSMPPMRSRAGID